MKSMILVSQSPRRKEILSNLHLDFTTEIANVKERVDKSLSFHDIVMEIAKKKVEVILSQQGAKEGLYLASDTIVVFEDEILGKPRTREHGAEMLNTLNGNTHRVYSSLVLYDTENQLWILDFDCTDVTFKKITSAEIDNYLDKTEFMDKAGSYGIQEHGRELVKSIDGDYFVVMGFPVERFKYRMKKHFSVDIDDQKLYTLYRDSIRVFTNDHNISKDE